jgi:hypothetical protein
MKGLTEYQEFVINAHRMNYLLFNFMEDADDCCGNYFDTGVKVLWKPVKGVYKIIYYVFNNGNAVLATMDKAKAKAKFKTLGYDPNGSGNVSKYCLI